MDKLQQDIKIGTAPRMFEVYATLANSKLTGIKELRELKKVVLETKIKLRLGLDGNGDPVRPDVKNLTVNNFNMSSAQLDEFIKGVKANSELNMIDTKFNVEETITENDQ
jgi:hypothetical protein